jgi:hypothetical protein
MSPKKLTEVQQLAADRRSAILAILAERGPCLSNYLLEVVRHRTKQGVLPQQINQDVRRLEKDGQVVVSKVTALGPGALSTSRCRGQKMLVVRRCARERRWTDEIDE